jgi:hypothetical protein
MKHIRSTHSSPPPPPLAVEIPTGFMLVTNNVLVGGDDVNGVHT